MRGTRIRYEYIKTFPPSLTNNLEYYSTRFSTNTHVLYIISFETNETLRHGGIGRIFSFSNFYFASQICKRGKLGVSHCLMCLTPSWGKIFVARDKTLKNERKLFVARDKLLMLWSAWARSTDPLIHFKTFQRIYVGWIGVL